MNANADKNDLTPEDEPLDDEELEATAAAEGGAGTDQMDTYAYVCPPTARTRCPAPS